MRSVLAQPAARVGSRLRRLPTGSGVVASYLILVVFVLAVDPRFFHWHNIQSMLMENAGLAVVVVGMTYVIIGGGYDLSVGAIAGLAGVLSAKVAVDGNVVVAVIIALAVGVACGLVNGFIVARLRVNSFMATFASGLAILGIALYYQGPQQIVVTKPSYDAIGLTNWGPIPEPIVLAAVVFVIGGLVLHSTPVGQQVYAVGGNREAARLVGIPVNWASGLTFVISGLLSGLAGVLIASQLGLGSYQSGQSLPIESIAAVVVGGVSVYGGEGRMWQAAFGMLILATLNNVFIALSWTTQAQDVAEGVVIVFALGASLMSRRLEERRVVEKTAQPPPDAAATSLSEGTVGVG